MDNTTSQELGNFECYDSNHTSCCARIYVYCVYPCIIYYYCRMYTSRFDELRAKFEN